MFLLLFFLLLLLVVFRLITGITVPLRLKVTVKHYNKKVIGCQSKPIISDLLS